MGGGNNVLKMLKLFVNNQNRSSLYEQIGTKKTSTNFKRAKLKDGLCIQIIEPIIKGETKQELPSPTVPQWLAELRMNRENQPMADMPTNRSQF